MRRKNLIVIGTLAVLYALFLWWYGGRGTPMTPQEADQMIAEIARRGINDTDGGGHLLDELRQLAASDDGNEFYMVNLIVFRQKAQYPPGSTYGDDPLEADARYNRALAPILLRHAGVPLFLGKVQGRFIDQPGDTPWQRVAIVRYRSRRDLLLMVLDLVGKNVAPHKWASIEKTQVVPAGALFSLAFVRLMVAGVLALLGAAVLCIGRRKS